MHHHEQLFKKKDWRLQYFITSETSFLNRYDTIRRHLELQRDISPPSPLRYGRGVEHLPPHGSSTALPSTNKQTIPFFR